MESCKGDTIEGRKFGGHLAYISAVHVCNLDELGKVQLCLYPKSGMRGSCGWMKFCACAFTNSS